MNAPISTRLTRRGRVRALAVAMIAVTSAVTAVGVAAANHGAGDLRAVGPVSSANGYPVWYRDAHGTEVELCLTGTLLCRFLPGDLPDPTSPISFPDNFPGEAFWWAADSVIDHDNGSALLVMAAEAAFASGEVATPGDQISFGRIRIRLDGLVPDADYTVTHPYGTTVVTAEPDGTVFVTDDVGSLTTPADFSAALDSPVFGGLLEWDPAESAAPAGYLGDPDVEHTVVGSPTGDNLFRVQGPAGSFGNATPAACPGVIDGSCIETTGFFVVGKRAVTSGVEALRAVRVDRADPETDYLEVFAKSRPGQTIVVSGAGIGTIMMRGDVGSDLYYAKVPVSGPAAPTEIIATNESDGTNWTASVTDLVTISSATYDVDTGELTVVAASSDVDSTLTASPGGVFVDGTATQLLTNPPLDVLVTSDGGGSDTAPVRLVGVDFNPIDIVAVATANPTTAIPGQVVALDATASSGDILSYQWEQTSGTTVAITDATADVATFIAPNQNADLVFRLTATGTSGRTSTAEVNVTVVADQAPVANAGPDQAAIVGTTVTLDGTGSQYATGYTWVQTSGTPVALAGGDTAIASFSMPIATVPLEFQLTATNGTVDSVDTVVINQVPDAITITRAELRTRRGSLRIDGTVSVFSVANEVTFYVSDGISGPPTGQSLGTAAVDPVLGDFTFRVNGNVVLPNGRVDIVTSRGGVLQEFAVDVRN